MGKKSMAFLILMKLGLSQGEATGKDLVELTMSKTFENSYVVSFRGAQRRGILRFLAPLRNDKQEKHEAVKQSEHNDDITDCRVITLLAMTFQSIFQSS